MPRVHRRTRTHVVALLCSALAATGLAALATIAVAPGAQAHGNVNDPIARGYRCLKEYGSTHLSTSYRDSDPMCWNAFQTSPSAMWNWNGMLIDGLGGQHRSRVPDVCAAGDNARYGVLSEPGPWQATNKPAQFTLNLTDQASHGADWIEVYISRNGFNVETDVLGWDDLVEVGRSGRIPTTGNGIVDPAVGGSAYAVPVNASGYTGRRVLFTLWKASHADQTYFLCSDVNIGGTGGNPTTTTTSRPGTTTTTTTTSRPVTTTTTTSRPVTTTTTSGGTGTGACSATYRTISSWSGGYQGEVAITAGSSRLSGWSVAFTLPNGSTITQSWNATVSGSGSSVTASNVSWNGGLNAGASTSFGFIGSGTPGTPSVTCTAS